MNTKKRVLMIAFILVIAASFTAGCGSKKSAEGQAPNAGTQAGNSLSNGTNTDNAAGNSDESSGGNQEQDNTSGQTEQKPEGSTSDGGNVDKAASSDPNSIAVLVNKEFGLPENYEPTDLVYPDVRFTFSDKIEKRKMRSEAAGALKEMFDAAEQDGVYLAGVSAYRSYDTQKSLFNRYVEQDGEEVAKTYSAVPGYSEHETGLAIDVSGSDGRCAAESCFGGTKEADWLAKHAPEYGFIIRYPEGKENITGYKYEPWHIRYVGKEISSDIAERGITLEEYYDAVPVSNTK